MHYHPVQQKSQDFQDWDSKSEANVSVNRLTNSSRWQHRVLQVTLITFGTRAGIIASFPTNNYFVGAQPLAKISFSLKWRIPPKGRGHPRESVPRRFSQIKVPRESAPGESWSRIRLRELPPLGSVNHVCRCELRPLRATKLPYNLDNCLKTERAPGDPPAGLGQRRRGRRETSGAGSPGSTPPSGVCRIGPFRDLVSCSIYHIDMLL